MEIRLAGMAGLHFSRRFDVVAVRRLEQGQKRTKDQGHAAAWLPVNAAVRRGQ